MILEFVNDINWFAVGTSVAAAFVIGLVVFSPPALGSYWARQVSRYTAIPEESITGGASEAAPLAGWLASIAVTAVVLATSAEAVGTDSASEGIVLGAVFALGFGAAFFSWPPLLARMPWAWWRVNSGAFLLMQVAMGAILGAWQ